MTDTNETQAEMSLADIRHEIDAVDREIFDCLLRRSELIKSVSQIKAATGIKAPLRPRREAEQLAQLTQWYTAVQTDMPLASIISIWREIIGAALAQQGGLRVHVTESTALAARLYFGASIDYLPLSGENFDLEVMLSGADIFILEPQDLLSVIDRLPAEVRCFARMQGQGAQVCLALGCFDDDLTGSVALSVVPIGDQPQASTCLASDGTRMLIETADANISVPCIGRYAILPVNDREKA